MRKTKRTARYWPETIDGLETLVDDGIYSNVSEALRDGAHRILSEHGVQVEEPDVDDDARASEVLSDA